MNNVINKDIPIDPTLSEKEPNYILQVPGYLIKIPKGLDKLPRFCFLPKTNLQYLLETK